MRHSNSGRKFSRSPSHRKAMFMNLAKALITHGRIRTTEMRAKDLRGIVERLVTLAKQNTLHARRLAYRELNDHAIVKHLFDKIGPLFAEIPGGYTRVLRLAKHRKGDNAPMAIIEFSHERKEKQKSQSLKETQDTPGDNKKEAELKEEKSSEAVTKETSAPEEKPASDAQTS